jgi:hypothetical protein
MLSGATIRLEGKAMPTASATGQFGPPFTKNTRLPRHAGYLTAVGALFLCLAQVPSARADSASCLAKVSSYVTELDELLSKERNWLTPYYDLNERYFPFRDCETDALLEVVRQSNFIRTISYSSRAKFYFIEFANDRVLVDFYYYVSDKKSSPDTNTVGWVNK